MATLTKSKILGTAPYFFVSDINIAIKYYHEILGFSKPGLWGEPPSFAMPSRDNFIIMLKQIENSEQIYPNSRVEESWDAYFWISDADDLFLEFKEKGAIIAYEPCIQELYGIKEFAVKDPDGHIIAFGENVEGKT